MAASDSAPALVLWLASRRHPGLRTCVHVKLVERSAFKGDDTTQAS
jgi:hypothetical protein